MAARVHRETSLPIRERQHIERAEGRNAGVADDDVHSAVFAHRQVECALDVALIADIELHGDRLTKSFHLRGDFGGICNVGDDDMRAFFGEAQSDRASDAARRASDQGDMTGDLLFFRQKRQLVELERPVFGVKRIGILERFVSA